MSGPFALAAVTAVLRRLLSNGLGEVDLSVFGSQAATVSAHPPDQIQVGTDEAARLNLFLYRVAPNGAMRNDDLPSRGPAGNRLTNPPQSLDLHYLLMAYGSREFYPEALLGYGLQVLHEVPFLSREFIRGTWPGGGEDAVEQALAGSGLADQLEQIRITPETLTTEELSRLWSAFQARLRPSAAFQASVLLLETERPARVPLPVLKRGEDDTGPFVVSGLFPPYPEIESLLLPKNQPSALQGDQIRILGHHLAGETGDRHDVTVTVRLNNTRRHVVIDIPVPPDLRDDKEVRVRIPDDPARLPAGVYTVSVILAPNGRPQRARSTNEMPLRIAPEFITAMPATFAAGLITLACRPEIQPGQQVSLGLGTVELPASPIQAQGSSVSFDAGSMTAGTYRGRLRVDGIDSLFIDRSDPKDPKFDPTQQITIT